MCHKVLTIDQRRAGVTVACCSRCRAGLSHEDGAEVLHIVLAPKHVSVSGAQTFEFASAGLGENPRAINDRRAARALTPIVLEDAVQRRLPQFPTRGGFDRVHHFLSVLQVAVKYSARGASSSHYW